MSVAYKCDRCGRYFEANKYYKEIRIDVTHCKAKKDDHYLALDFPVEFTIDLCPKCIGEVFETIEKMYWGDSYISENGIKCEVKQNGD